MSVNAYENEMLEPNDKRLAIVIPSGIENQLDECYMNCCIQMLFTQPYLRMLLCSTDYSSLLEKSTGHYSTSERTEYHSFRHWLDSLVYVGCTLAYAKKKTIVSREAMINLGLFGLGHQDPLEVITFLVQRLDEMCKDVPITPRSSTLLPPEPSVPENVVPASL